MRKLNTYRNGQLYSVITLRKGETIGQPKKRNPKRKSNPKRKARKNPRRRGMTGHKARCRCVGCKALRRSR